VFGIAHGGLNINGNSRVANNSTLASTAEINLGEATIANSKLISEKNVNAQKTTLDLATVSSTAGDVYLSDLTVMNNSNLMAKNILQIEKVNLMNANVNGGVVKLINSKLDNSKVNAVSDILIKGGSNNNSNILSNGTLTLIAVESANSNISSVGEMSVSGANTLQNSKLFTNGKLKAEGLYANNSSVLAEDTAVIEKSKFENSKVYGKNYLTLKSNIVNNSNLSSVDIEIGNSEVRNTKLDAKRHVSFYKNSIAENIYADYLQSISVTTDSKIKNSNLRVGYLLLDGVEAENINANAKYDLKYYDTRFLGGAVSAYSRDNIILHNIKADYISADALYVEIKNSDLKASNINSIENINITDTNLNNATVRFGGKLRFLRSNGRFSYTIKNSNITGSNIVANNSIISDSVLTATNSIDAEYATISGTNMSASRNIYLKQTTINNSNLVANNSISATNANIENSLVKAINNDISLQGSKLLNVEAEGRFSYIDGTILGNGTTLKTEEARGIPKVIDGVILRR
ncbi:MAG: hypothetical protein Q4E87_04840, partial [bacterium]|nr:hypothetical protein [bacterium]